MALPSVGLVAVDALADYVAPLHARATAIDGATRDRVQTSIARAVSTLGHVAIADDAITRAEKLAGDTVATSAGLVMLGKNVGADWVVAMTVAPGATAATIHLELTACQVASGRVESVSRDVDAAADSDAPIAEMVRFLVRADGMGDDPIPWEVRTVRPHPVAPPSASVAPSASAAPPDSIAPPFHWDDGRHVQVDVGVSAAALVLRDSTAYGSRLAGGWDVTVADAPSVADTEIYARFGGYYGSAGALYVLAGGRYTQPLSGAVGLRVGIGAGVFFSTTQSKYTRALLAFEPALVVRLGGTWVFEATPADSILALSTDSPLLFLGLRGAIGARF